MERRASAEEKDAQKTAKPGAVGASGEGKVRDIRAGHDILLGFRDGREALCAIEPGLGRKDVASDKFASADLASLGGVIYRQHNRVGMQKKSNGDKV
jgi:hypothetical protein